MEDLLEFLFMWMDLGVPERPDASMWRKVIFGFAPLAVMLGMGIVALFHLIVKTQ